jgi:hypothetical protein
MGAEDPSHALPDISRRATIDHDAENMPDRDRRPRLRRALFAPPSVGRRSLHATVGRARDLLSPRETSENAKRLK